MPSIWIRFFKRFLRDLGLNRSDARVDVLEEPVSQAVKELAQREGCAPGEMVARLVSEALERRRTAEQRLIAWKGLSPREREVAALACLNYTNLEIARLLGSAEETVKSQMQSILRKFDLRRKEDLRQALAEWDFHDWDPGEKGMDPEDMRIEE